MFRKFTVESWTDWVLIPWWLLRYVFAWYMWQVDMINVKMKKKRFWCRDTAWNPVMCSLCLWSGPRRWAIHDYCDDGSMMDVEPCDLCPRCGNEV